MGTGLTAAETITPARQFSAELQVPGDKSIAHRALLLGAIALGETRIAGLPDGADVAATVACLRGLGVGISTAGPVTIVRGAGLEAFRRPAAPLDCANSGTTMRLLAGLLAGGQVTATLQGDASLQRRPMDRVAIPLRAMGAQIQTRDGRPPIEITGAQLFGREHALERPSAQVKSALLLAGLHAHGPTIVREPVRTRDHTERLLDAMGVTLASLPDGVQLEPVRSPPRPLDLAIPGDLSSAAFFLCAAALRPGWSATVRGVGLNRTRTTFLDILRAMGAQVQLIVDDPMATEPKGQVTVRGAELNSVSLGTELVSQAIDEIPVLLVVASQARGRTHVTGAGELRVKESDRLSAMTEGLRRMGVAVEEGRESITVVGPSELRGAAVEAAGDHRIAMALAVAGLIAAGPTRIADAGAVAVSYPGFFAALREAAR